ncbi:aspartate/glutamate racemase family protein [Streptomyces sp. NPDC097619]|uniref:aspartate/glutamate racemase family protein n=1 Tax=Streptomyces sp. NPDC097619 TaxID=3157228 RepID=UPI0033207277
MTPGAAPAPLALLHTSPVHVPVFDALRDRHRAGLPLTHVVDPALLAAARAGAGAEELARSVAAALGPALAAGTGAVLCTCSTIGAVAEGLAAELGVPVLRVDRPMAERAVAAGRRIAVLVALEDTVAPTLGLIREVAERGGVEVEPRVRVVPGAWERFESGDTEGYLAAVADEAVAAGPVDAVVLAQASMAAATARMTARGMTTGGVTAGSAPVPVPVLSVPVLCSPESGFLAAVELLKAPRRRRGRDPASPAGEARSRGGAP